ncbi:F-box/kelch-repeat protein At3g23880-like [Apium graveolens]|uniref:F-box/kelch-repeat protein At3g23880-like n=1 Tax=Apium graveolens TaxID=4045 RepID=UPI003D7A4FA9
MGSLFSKNKSLAILPEDIIKGEILIRLPVKSLVRFRCVCKSWRYLLSCDPCFAKSHLAHSCLDCNNATLIVKYRSNRAYEYKLNLLNSQYLKVSGSVNGLVCVYHNLPNSIPFIGIWNPATSQYKDFFTQFKASHIPLDSGVSVGFGFDSFTDDYKVIFITMSYDSPSPLVADVYSCNAESWGNNSIESSFLLHGILFPWPTIVHGRPYWYNYGVESPEHYFVIYFDLHHEVFKLLPGIKYVMATTQNRVMVNLRDSLAMLFDYTPDYTPRSVDVYIFNERSGSWSKNYSVTSIKVPKNMPLLNCFSNGDLLFRRNLCLNLVTISQESHGINMFGNEVYDYYGPVSKVFCPCSYSYIESLVSVKGMHPMLISEAESDIFVIDWSF